MCLIKWFIKKDFNKNYVTPLSYKCSNETNKTNGDFPLSLTTGATYFVVAVESLFWIRWLKNKMINNSDNGMLDILISISF